MPSMNENLRIPPQSLEAEQALLGAVLSNNQALEKVVEFLRPEHFANPAHGKIYEAAVNYFERGRIADPITLKALFDTNEDLKDVGGSGYLIKLAAASTSIINTGDYGKQIFDRYIRRQLIGLGNNIVNDAYAVSMDQEAMDQVGEAEERLYHLATEGTQEGGPKSLGEGLNESLAMINKAMSGDGLSGVSTGLTYVDKLLGGLHNSDLIIVAGRPAMGKTAMATTLAFNAAQYFEEENKKPGAVRKSVAFFSLEMSAEQLATRILSSKAEISGHLMRTGKLTEDQFDELAAAVQVINKIPLFVDDTPGITLSTVRNRARRLKRDKEKGLGLIIIDYLQLISSAGHKENRVQELSEMTRALKIMAKELDVPVIVLSQLSRLLEQRDNKRPILSDLRESGSIEQDADIVTFVYRHIYYLEKNIPTRHLNETAERFAARQKEWEDEKEKLKNVGEFIVSKQRHGPTGTVKLFFSGEHGKFTTLENPESYGD